MTWPTGLDPDEVEACLREAAERFVMPRFLALRPSEIHRKRGHLRDVVTEADLEAEAWLGPKLQELLPGSCVVGEEAVSANPQVLDLLTGETPVWVLDPVDGTRNFTRGRETFCLIVALVHRGETLGGWIHEPMAHRTVHARPGHGAWSRQAGSATRLQIDTTTPLDRWQVVIRGSVGRPLARFRARRAFGALINDHCAGIEHIGLASGRLHAALYGRVYPWDHAAGVLVHQEAGGHVAHLDGRPYRPTGVHEALLLAPSAVAWEAASSALLGG